MLDASGMPIFQRRKQLHNEEEFSFNDASELCEFTAIEIRRSRIRYKEIAERAHVCPSTVSKLAAGTTHFPRAATLLEILRVLGFTVRVCR